MMVEWVDQVDLTALSRLSFAQNLSHGSRVGFGHTKLAYCVRFHSIIKGSHDHTVDDKPRVGCGYSESFESQ